MRENVKSAAAEVIAHLPEDCTWDDVMHRIYLRQQIQDGLNDEAAGRVAALDWNAIKHQLSERWAGRRTN